MILSFFLRSKECHIYTENFSKIYSVHEPRDMADSTFEFLQEVIKTNCDEVIEKLIFPLGPSSFTTQRIIHSIAKGLQITNKTAELIPVSNFVTYLSLINNESGMLAIPTLRGDYFTSTYQNSKLNPIQILNKTNIEKYATNIYFEADMAFDNCNLAAAQVKVLSSELIKYNAEFISTLHHIDYGFTPEYKY